MGWVRARPGPATNLWGTCYTSQGANFRDTDWYEVTVGAYPGFDMEIIAEYPTNMYVLGPQDCDNVGVLQSITVEPCDNGSIVVDVPTGEAFWLWVGPSTYDGPVSEYTYQVIFYYPTAVENHSWSAVKSMFN